jgi:hypothetical protein
LCASERVPKGIIGHPCIMSTLLSVGIIIAEGRGTQLTRWIFRLCSRVNRRGSDVIARPRGLWKLLRRGNRWQWKRQRWGGRSVAPLGERGGHGRGRAPPERRGALRRTGGARGQWDRSRRQWWRRRCTRDHGHGRCCSRSWSRGRGATTQDAEGAPPGQGAPFVRAQGLPNAHPGPGAAEALHLSRARGPESGRVGGRRPTSDAQCEPGAHDAPWCCQGGCDGGTSAGPLGLNLFAAATVGASFNTSSCCP